MADRVLVAVAAILRDTRAYDLAARYGGDEFVLLMPETTEIEAVAVLERIRAGIVALNERRKLPFLVRLSIGIAASTQPTADLLVQADAEMYRDKDHRRPQTAPLRTGAAEDPTLRRQAS
ncbi:MAG: GGDEF domain-containing protein [Armatimonadetes bacterium]|nr:GGDEF domain-containing protein [Armatimonadota bacterium]